MFIVTQIAQTYHKKPGSTGKIIMNRWGLSREEETLGNKLFTEWTTGLAPIEQRISIFSHIRDIPYAIMPEWEDTSRLLIMMIQENRGWCGPKHILLSWMFEKLKIETSYVLIPFRWMEQPVRYPDSIKELASFMPDTNHLCCKALLNGIWQLLDATWDPLLIRAGFPINESWNGISGTLPAVTAIDPTKKKPLIPLIPSARMQRIEFVTHLNRWMEDVRTS